MVQRLPHPIAPIRLTQTEPESSQDMHDALRQRLMRKIESLPDQQIYQILDYIEFLDSKYAPEATVEASGLQKFAEGLEDKMRRRAVSPSTIREAFQLISAADRVLSGVSSAGRQILNDLAEVIDVEEGAAVPGAPEDVRRIDPDPRRSGATGSGTRAGEVGAGRATGAPGAGGRADGGRAGDPGGTEGSDGS